MMSDCILVVGFKTMDDEYDWLLELFCNLCVSVAKVGLQDQLTMDSYGTDTVKELDQTSEEEYATQSKLIKEFITIPSIDKAWIFNSGSGNEWPTTFHISNFFENFGIKKIHLYCRSSGNGCHESSKPFG